MSTQLTLHWAKKPDGGWYEFEGYDFSGIEDVGVYHIWCADFEKPFNVRCGQGVIGARLTVHRTDNTITRHGANGTLYVTWAKVPSEHLDRVERFLADYYSPVEGERYPDVRPLVVNLPGA